MNITDSMKVISVVDANIAPMNPYQPLPFQMRAVAQNRGVVDSSLTGVTALYP